MPGAIDWSTRGMLHLVTLTHTHPYNYGTITDSSTLSRAAFCESPLRYENCAELLRPACLSATGRGSQPLWRREQVERETESQSRELRNPLPTPPHRASSRPLPHHSPRLLAGMPTPAASWTIVILQQCSTAGLDTLTENDCWRSHCCDVDNFLCLRSLGNLDISKLTKS